MGPVGWAVKRGSHFSRETPGNRGVLGLNGGLGYEARRKHGPHFPARSAAPRANSEPNLNGIDFVIEAVNYRLASPQNTNMRDSCVVRLACLGRTIPRERKFHLEKPGF